MPKTRSTIKMDMNESEAVEEPKVSSKPKKKSKAKPKKAPTKKAMPKAKEKEAPKEVTEVKPKKETPAPKPAPKKVKKPTPKPKIDYDLRAFTLFKDHLKRDAPPIYLFQEGKPFVVGSKMSHEEAKLAWSVLESPSGGASVKGNMNSKSYWLNKVN